MVLLRQDDFQSESRRGRVVIHAHHLGELSPEEWTVVSLARHAAAAYGAIPGSWPGIFAEGAVVDIDNSEHTVRRRWFGLLYSAADVILALGGPSPTDLEL